MTQPASTPAESSPCMLLQRPRRRLAAAMGLSTRVAATHHPEKPFALHADSSESERLPTCTVLGAIAPPHCLRADLSGVSTLALLCDDATQHDVVPLPSVATVQLVLERQVQFGYIKYGHRSRRAPWRAGDAVNTRTAVEFSFEHRTWRDGKFRLPLDHVKSRNPESYTGGICGVSGFRKGNGSWGKQDPGNPE
ncbi:hypothetical protein K437DRAFT_108963 [Tilletiaria anomala UBC 951]|uniref:Uncharacterized protein n=1 Tax=Tilletiaria anomala (strain ATCC 24038 / CBS 436.72 / UBC 951) TaxID=1037660 RepID=A0A066VXT2_TILAU|nr:uncharacterized protein K437DRAFT_108963 [Tilletiaria anomala UBC 951]KDN46286.1 hypothetical protein K437DRAFT_108963 [Tilletiaria anomala UBC 951]